MEKEEKKENENKENEKKVNEKKENEKKDKEIYCCPVPSGVKPCCVAPEGKERPIPPLPDNEIIEMLDHGYEKLQAAECKSLLKKCLKRNVFDKLKYRVTSEGSSLLDVVQSGMENYDSHVGIYAPDADSYSVFAPLFDCVICEYHGFPPTSKQPPLDWGDAKVLSDLDPSGKLIRSTRVRCGRSVKGYPFVPRMTEELYRELEKEVCEALSTLDGVHSGNYRSLQHMSDSEQTTLINDHYLFKPGDKFLKSAKACQFWPVGRGIFMNEDKTFLVWVGEEDHIRIISMQMGGNLGEVYQRMVEGVKKLEKNLSFVHHPRLGFLTFCPTNLGTTIRASVMIKLESLGMNLEKLESIAQKYHLQVRGSSGEHSASEDGMYDISNKRRLGLTEFEAVRAMHEGLKELLKEEGLK